MKKDKSTANFGDGENNDGGPDLRYNQDGSSRQENTKFINMAREKE